MPTPIQPRQRRSGRSAAPRPRLVALPLALAPMLALTSACGAEPATIQVTLSAPGSLPQLASCAASANLANLTAALFISGHRAKECPLQLNAASGSFEGLCEEITVGSRTRAKPRYAVVLYRVADPHVTGDTLLVAVLAQVLDLCSEDLQPGQGQHDVALGAQYLLFDQGSLDLAAAQADSASDFDPMTTLAAQAYAASEVVAAAELSLDPDGDDCGNAFELCAGQGWDAATDTTGCP